MENSEKPFSLITGASLGIGKAMAEECARLGMNIALVSLPGENLAALAQQLKEQYKIKAITLELDLSLPDSPKNVLDWINEVGVKVNMLINNAGFGTHGHFEEIKHEVNLKMLQLHVITSYSLIHLFLPMLKAQEKSYILNVSSIAGITPTPFKGVYSASKAFIAWLSRAIQRELKNTNVRVSVVLPGGVITSDKVKARIQSAGWLARKSAVYPEHVARLSIRRLLKGKAITIPGFGGKIGYVLARYLPFSIGLRILEGPMSKRSE